MTGGAARAVAAAGPEVLFQLQAVVEGQGLDLLAGTLGRLGAFVGEDLARIEVELKTLPQRPDLVGRSATHLLELGGKRLRPLCVALAARLGSGFDDRAAELAAAVELVHSATLLHDDVVDSGTMRRGEPAARLLYGNAASVFAGDWLLIEALRRVRRAKTPGVLDELLCTIDEMIRAEALQLARRGLVSPDRASYFAVIDGKTASLFRWALLAGGRAGGLGDGACDALARYGRHLGLAFQLVDDTLDFAGDQARTGKALFTDLVEGKMTHPLLVALEREPALEPRLSAIARGADTEAHLPEVLAALERTSALAATTKLAEEHARRALDCLDEIPDAPARASLAFVAETAVHRRS